MRVETDSVAIISYADTGLSLTYVDHTARLTYKEPRIS